MVCQGVRGCAGEVPGIPHRHLPSHCPGGHHQAARQIEGRADGKSHSGGFVDGEHRCCRALGRGAVASLGLLGAHRYRHRCTAVEVLLDHRPLRRLVLHPRALREPRLRRARRLPRGPVTDVREPRAPRRAATKRAAAHFGRRGDAEPVGRPGNRWANVRRQVVTRGDADIARREPPAGSGAERDSQLRLDVPGRGCAGQIGAATIDAWGVRGPSPYHGRLRELRRQGECPRHQRRDLDGGQGRAAVPCAAALQRRNRALQAGGGGHPRLALGGGHGAAHAGQRRAEVCICDAWGEVGWESRQRQRRLCLRIASESGGPRLDEARLLPSEDLASRRLVENTLPK
mmetsp:Transcript_113770/g.361569  ORF Transcript_113770/g.361569 Transcript_113770/m.361569 type:complete len:344 (-) Transcript_113770:3-1034(-)